MPQLSDWRLCYLRSRIEKREWLTTLAEPHLLKNYCVTQKELLAVVWPVKHFRAYLYDWKIRLQTDHSVLLWLCKKSKPSLQLARWLEFLADIKFKIEHGPGTRHGYADGLSCQRDCCCDYTYEWKQCDRIQRMEGLTKAQIQAGIQQHPLCQLTWIWADPVMEVK